MHHVPREILSVGHDPRLLTHRHILLKNAGYSVISAAHPVKAMNMLSTRNFDLVLVGLSGHAERVAIERLQTEIHVPVIFLCCDQFDPTSGICTCQYARLSPEELLQRIAAVLADGVTH
jgi:CheY-like chemotaxis protein